MGTFETFRELSGVLLIEDEASDMVMTEENAFALRDFFAASVPVKIPLLVAFRFCAG
jgi:Na+/H+ antiporter NhaB